MVGSLLAFEHGIGLCVKAHATQQHPSMQVQQDMQGQAPAMPMDCYYTTRPISERRVCECGQHSAPAASHLSCLLFIVSSAPGTSGSARTYIELG